MDSMAKYEKQINELVYQQDDGEITAWLTNFEEKMELPHEGSSRYKKIFHFLIILSFIYLTIVFLIF